MIAQHLALPIALAALLMAAPGAQAGPPAPDLTQVSYHTIQIDGLNIFYREAGDPRKPTILLLHGYPSSSHMFRDLMPRLAGRFHLVAPDYPGFGNSDTPSVTEWSYTFEHITGIVDALAQKLGLARYSLYVQDYGAPVGFRLATRHPERIQAIVTQNGNAYEEGLNPGPWNVIRAFWKDPSPQNSQPILALQRPAATRGRYINGARDPSRVSPDAWNSDQWGLDRPGQEQIQLALFYDYRTNVALYPEWHAYFRKHQPPTLAVWGKNDASFGPAGALAFAKDLPKAEVHLLDTGHFALEEDSDVIAQHIIDFLSRNL